MRGPASWVLALILPLGVTAALACPMGVDCPMQGEGTDADCHGPSAPEPPSPCCAPLVAPSGKEVALQPPSLLVAVVALLPIVEAEGAMPVPATHPAPEAPARAHGAELLSLLDRYLL